MQSKQSVTVIVPTFNGERWISDLLRQLESQNFTGDIETLVIDSGSTDDTLRIVREFTDVRLIEIPNSDFGHGKTRNMGAQLANGEFIVFLTQDAVPAHPNWLQAMLEPFEISSKVMAVFGKQTPRRLAPPLVKYDIQRVFSQFSPEAGIVLFKKAPYLDERHADFLDFYSDVNSASRRDYLVNVNPLRDVDYAEDLFFAQETISAGFLKAYAPMGEVVHSNDLTFQEIRGRAFDETRALITLGKVQTDEGVKISLKKIIRRSLVDARFILRDHEVSWKRKTLNLLINPFMIAQQELGRRDAIIASRQPEARIQSASLDESKRVSR